MAVNHNDPQLKYLKTRIETASQPQLLLMLFEGAVRKLNIAKKAIAEKDVEKAHTELTKVQKIFTELMCALDLEKGGELAANLLRIYDFIYHHLVKANIKQDISLIDEVLPIVKNLQDGWNQAVEQYLNGGNGEAAAKAEREGTTGGEAPPPAPSEPEDKPAPEPARRFQTVSSSSSPQQPAQRPRLNLRG